jgi:Zn finger protein HypA/HybF involved in hydrogenase expression
METKEIPIDLDLIATNGRKLGIGLRKEIVLRRTNIKRYCPDCKELVEIKMEGKVGRCPICRKVLYIIDSKKIEKENGEK